MLHFLRAIARALTGVSYAYFGFDAFREPGGRVDMAAPTLAKLREVAPLPADNETIVRLNGAVQMTAGALLTVGVLPRLSATALVGSLVPTTIAGHSFWKIDNPAKRAQQRTQFLKNTAMIGGLVAVLIAPAD
ncbi:DoxX family membrane protein [Aldersonia sp. NBC_00410]|uniref:DoxX family protein n=1 Tax=Aldersonia sp. NBC_00410 TaxID=2975954 RepID=UPI00224D92B1|nr:DoxX family membrane protein [Aldersonia sp. NBC_00410]MCX5045765.1 DoxX family membrane protein [Aldersonia sp. NBC_00410]